MAAAVSIVTAVVVAATAIPSSRSACVRAVFACARTAAALRAHTDVVSRFSGSRTGGLIDRRVPRECGSQHTTSFYFQVLDQR